MRTTLSIPLNVLASAGSLDELRALADASGQAADLLPLLALAGVAAAGLALWAIGGRFVRPSVILVTSAAGGYAGFMIGDGFDPAMGRWIGLALGVSAGMLLGCWLFRMAAGVLLAAFLAVAAPTAAAVSLDYDLADRAVAMIDVVREAARGDGSDDEDAVRVEVVSPSTLDARDADERHTPAHEDAPDADGVVERAAAWAGEFLVEAASGGEQIWDEMAPDERRTLVVAGVVGALGGLMIGVVWPTLAMAVLTSGLGAALMLGAGSRLAIHFRPELDGSLPSSPIAWAAIWVSVSLLGAVIQIAPHRKRKPAKARDGDDE